VPTDNIIDALDEEEEVIEQKLLGINEHEEEDKDILNNLSDESDQEFGASGSEDEDRENGFDNGIKEIDP
jgi:hypothetical protein